MAKHDLETLRHSCAHVMAQAIMELYPQEEPKLGIGPTIENGFYYDIDMEKRISDDDLSSIENKMNEIIKRADKITRHEVSREEAIEVFTQKKQDYKVELIKDLPEGETISYYTQGDSFIDLCRGPHVETTRQIPTSFKLLHTAGAYWRGDETRPMLQRVYAVCFDDKKKLKEHLKFLEEAKKRDHRKLGKELSLFHFEECTPGNPFFYPKGTVVYNSFIEFARRILRAYDYEEVLTPLILDVDLWHTSGHYQNYQENMYFTVVDEKEYAVKPMNCPGHMLLFKSQAHSYRDLPLRYAEFGKVHRYERSGAMAGLTRVRSFVQDDAHIYLTQDQIQAEVQSLIEMFLITYKHFGFEDIKINLSTRPEKKKIGSDEIWDLAEDALRKALEASGIEYQLKEGDGAFYGPKIDFDVADALKRYHQLGTIQLDFMMPERFDLTYNNSEGEKVRPVVIHRALLGSIERFFGVYLEHVAGIFPFWIAPEQAIIVPVNNDIHGEYAKSIARKLKKKGFRVKVDLRNETMGLKTRQIQKSKVPFMIVIGDKEMESNSLALRAHGTKFTKVLSMDEAIEKFTQLDNEKIPTGMSES
ncbi:MAG: threonine--tRNA ligase [Bacteriovoracaceae bacterium]|jgi:threonyl-tRNA synthetase|nr:threonine--tRNA ligase [Bacteriovoracaceae bacterium]